MYFMTISISDYISHVFPNDITIFMKISQLLLKDKY